MYDYSVLGFPILEISRSIPELIPVLSSQPAGDRSHKPGGRLSLLSARPAVTSPAAEHHRPLASTKLYCLVTEAHVCKQLVQVCTQQCGGRDSNSGPVDGRSGSPTTEPHSAYICPIYSLNLITAGKLKHIAPTLLAHTVHV